MSVWILVSACKQQVMEPARRGLFSLGWSSMCSCQQMQDYDEPKILGIGDDSGYSPWSKCLWGSTLSL